MPVYLLPEQKDLFPPPNEAEADGLIAYGGDLSPERLLNAYSLGFFPWYGEGQPIMWWHPPERFILFPEQLHVSKSMRPYFNQGKYRVSYNQCFARVIEKCAIIKRQGQDGTWITDEMIEAYKDLHHLGFAHSVEVWEKDQLVGGLYGLIIGKIFYGESMFSQAANASKFGFISLVRKLQEQNFLMIDCQQETKHLASLGAELIPQSEFTAMLNQNMRAIEEGKYKTKSLLK